MKRVIFGTLIHLMCQLTFAETIWLDVRSPGEYESDHLPGSIHIPYKQIKQLASSKLPNKNSQINVYCVAGVRAGIAKSALEDMGYENVVNVVSLNKARELSK